MASTSNSSLAKSRSLRSNSLKPPSLNPPQPAASASGPSNITLFLTNLRLLELDLRGDWPDIAPVTFSTSTRQENQKKRIQCVEWALYHLFALWDPEETRNKLQPFFPPLEPLQSLNLRAALFRCLDQAKKNGVLGRDTVLRKTMLDECKGERLEEVLAVFSNTVLKRVLQEGGSDRHEAIAQQLAYENFSYTGERTVLSTLILAHKASLSTHMRAKEESRAKYRDFSNLLDLNDRRIVRRHEQLKELINERHPEGQLSNREARGLQDQVQRNWSGIDEWLKTILYGDNRSSQDGLLATPFERAWKYVESNSIGDIEGKQGVGLLEQLDARVRDQENRLARRQDFGKSLSRSAPGSSTKTIDVEARETRIDLGFNFHQGLQIGRTNTKAAEVPSSISLDDYTRLVENMKAELSEVGKPQVRNTRPARQSLRPEKPLHIVSSPSQPESPTGKDEEWSSASESDVPSPGFNNCAAKSTSQTPPSEVISKEPEFEELVLELPSMSTMPPPPPRIATKSRPSVEIKPMREPTPVRKDSSPPKRVVCTPPPIDTHKPADSESDLADQILNSMSAASPSPKKQRHTLSLAERTRLSMARTSLSQYPDMHDDCDNIADLPQLCIRAKPSNRTSLSAPADDEKHAALIERTRKSMAGFEAAQKTAQLERRRSVKDQKRKQRQSSYFPKLEKEEVAVTPGIDKQELMEGDPDYESVFMSRPKIKTSPAVSPFRMEDALGN